MTTEAQTVETLVAETPEAQSDAQEQAVASPAHAGPEAAGRRPESPAAIGRPATPPASEGTRICTTCGRAIEGEDGWIRLPCPGCHKNTITRCGSCKVLENKYACACGFEGP